MRKPANVTFPYVEKLTVHLDLAGSGIELGTLAWSRSERRSYFEFSSRLLDSPLPVSPFKLTTSSGLKAAPYQPFQGLHGLFNDSLPDGWGRLLLDRSLQRKHIDYDTLSPLDRLTYVGRTGMGALQYSPHKTFAPPSEEADLDAFANEIEQTLREVPTADIDLLLQAQGGSAGAKPKIMIGLHDANGKIVTASDPPPGYEAWIVKFKALSDPDEIGAEEYAYSLMAQAAGIDMPETRLLAGRTGCYFAVKRFDRSAEGRAHIHTASGLLEADHRTPQNDYETLLNLTRVLTRNEPYVRQMYRRMVFNVLARNRDDHAKNHAFRMTPDGSWHLTPAYDLTLSQGPAGEHSLAIAGEGRNPGVTHLLAAARSTSIPTEEARSIVDEVKATIANWPAYAQTARLSDRRTSEIGRLLG